jgi:hypothetical protein
VIADGIYDEKGPFLADDVYDAFKRTKADIFAFLIHANTFLVDRDYNTINLIA